MRQFLNAPDDVEWLKTTHLKGVPALPAFASFVIVGNEDSPDELNLYTSVDPLYTDGFTRVQLNQNPPVYCVVETVQGGANAHV